MTGAYQGRVYIHRQTILSFTRFRHTSSVPGEVPGHEDFIRSRTFAEYLFPCAVSLITVRSPHGTELRDKLLLLFLQIVHKLGWHYLIEQRICDCTAITRVGNHSDFILD